MFVFTNHINNTTHAPIDCLICAFHVVVTIGISKPDNVDDQLWQAMLELWNTTLTVEQQNHLIEHGFFPSDWYTLATTGEQVTDTVIDYIINNILLGDLRK